jgi:hypothetical protein
MASADSPGTPEDTAFTEMILNGLSAGASPIIGRGRIMLSKLAGLSGDRVARICRRKGSVVLPLKKERLS